MIKLLKYIKGSAILCAILAPLSMVLEVVMDLMQPTFMSQIIDVGIANGDIDYVISVGIKMIIAAFVGLLAGGACTYFAVIASMTMGENLRNDLFAKIQSLSFLEIDKFKTSSLITRLTNDVTQVQNAVLMALRIMVRAPLLCLGGLVMAIYLSAKLSLLFIVVIPLILISVVFIIKKSFPLFTGVQEKIDNVNVVMRESILGVRVIKAFTIEGRVRDRFDKVNDDLRDISIKSQNMSLLLWPIATLIMNLTVVLVLWFGGNMVKANTLELGKIMAFINYLIQIMGSLIMVVQLVMNFSRATASAKRVNEVLETETSIKEIDNAKELSNFDIEFKNVSLKYNESSEYILHNISFTAKEGEKVSIIGSTGSGKSSFINLIPRLYDVTEGEVFIGGINVKELKLKELRENIGLVLQENILFEGTIESNIAFGNDKARREEIEAASKSAQAYDFIIKKEDGFESIVEQRGGNLSGGQKQRLSIARTLVREPRVLIMDDSSSALDMSTAAKLQKAIKEKMKKNTVITIAQRISSVIDSDKIIVLNEGKISGIGTHKELLKNNEIYRGIAVSQLGEEVLLDD